jgi:hypothetical protein
MRGVGAVDVEQVDDALRDWLDLRSEPSNAKT